jgi:RHS repeat-associated protein
MAYSQYDFSTGVLTGFKDRNGVITQTIYNDPFDRPKQIKAALGTTLENHTAMYYAPTSVFGVNLTSNDVLTARDQVSIDDGNLRSWTHTDGFGRTFESWTSDPQGDVKVATGYDGLGRAVQTSNPFRPATETEYNTTTAYDLAGRVKTVTTADNAVVTTAYNGARVLVIDQAGRQRISQTDGLGRLSDVWEVTVADSATEPVTFPGYSGITAGYRTTYSYDALDDLSTAKQRIGTSGTLQTRTFAYDGLKRLLQAINPESGAINYTYDANSNLATKLDARSITTTYTYDALNRVTSRTYMGDPQSTPAVFYKYDGQTVSGAPSFTRGSSIGRLVGVTYGSGTAGSYRGYDQLGRVNVSYQQTDSQNYGFSYGYNLASEMTSETYPSGRQVITEYDSAGRTAGISAAGGYYAGATPSDATNRIQYASHGAVPVMALGNGRWEHTTYDPKRLQPTQIGLGTSGTDSSILKLDYEYTSPCQTGNNGNVLKQTITAPGLSLTQNYCYDSLNRLSSASENTGANWSQTYGFDRYGNRWVSASTGYTLSTLTPINSGAFNTATNRLFASGYDFAGNQTSDAQSRSFTYDAENRQLTFNGTSGQYFYDGDGHRVKRVTGSITTIFVYDGMGQFTAEYTNDTTPPVGGGGTSYLTSDHLGSTRVVTKSDGSVKARYDYLPFGEEIPSTIGSRGGVTGYGGADSTRQKFTQKERDNESGLDYFLARYYSSAEGRFTSPDEFTGGPIELYEFADEASSNPTFYAELHEPQSLNKYQYSLNNPLRYVDPDGHQAIADALKQAGQAAQGTGNPYLATAGKVLIGVTAAIVVLKDVDWEEVAKDAGKSAAATGCLAGVDCTGHAQSLPTAPANAQQAPSQSENASAAREQERARGEKLDRPEPSQNKPQKTDKGSQKSKKDRSVEGATEQQKSIEAKRNMEVKRAREGACGNMRLTVRKKARVRTQRSRTGNIGINTIAKKEIREAI